jgi:hypothetical protein
MKKGANEQNKIFQRKKYKFKKKKNHMKKYSTSLATKEMQIKPH